MIFNIEEITEKIRQKRRARPFKTAPAKRVLPRLIIAKTQKTKPKPPTPTVVSPIPQNILPKVFEIAGPDREKKKTITKIIVDNYRLDKASSKILLAMLYWGSGSKYPSSNFVAFSNRDHNLVKTFLRLLRKTFNLDESKIRVHLQLHSDQSKKKMLQYWSYLLKVSPDQFYEPTITPVPAKAKSANYFGTCTVRYYSLELLLKITKMYEEIANVL